jgi:hypothetical protein
VREKISGLIVENGQISKKAQLAERQRELKEAQVEELSMKVVELSSCPFKLEECLNRKPVCPSVVCPKCPERDVVDCSNAEK